LKPIISVKLLNEYEGQTAVVDVMTWLYKGSFACSYELALGTPTSEFLSYPLKMLRFLKNKKIKTICVFDGLHLKAKSATE
jgi:exonuclease-1